MRLDICTDTVDDRELIITERSSGSYLPEGSELTAKNRFTWTETAAVDLLRLNRTDGHTYTGKVISMREKGVSHRLAVPGDGWFTVIRMVIPTERWVDRERAKNGSIINTYDTVYYTDGTTLYTYRKGKQAVTGLDDMLEEVSDNTTISRAEADYVSVRDLEARRLEAYRSLFSNRMYNGGCHTDACEANRLEAALNLTRHYVRWGMLAEAERILEKADRFRTARKEISYHNSTCGCT